MSDYRHKDATSLHHNCVFKRNEEGKEWSNISFSFYLNDNLSIKKSIFFLIIFFIFTLFTLCSFFFFFHIRFSAPFVFFVFSLAKLHYFIIAFAFFFLLPLLLFINFISWFNHRCTFYWYLFLFFFSFLCV